MVEPVAVACEECGSEMHGYSPDLRLEVTCDDKLLTYCAERGRGELTRLRHWFQSQWYEPAREPVTAL
jgi:hypothetical protein